MRWFCHNLSRLHQTNLGTLENKISAVSNRSIEGKSICALWTASTRITRMLTSSGFTSNNFSASRSLLRPQKYKSTFGSFWAKWLFRTPLMACSAAQSSFSLWEFASTQNAKRNETFKVFITKASTKLFVWMSSDSSTWEINIRWCM